MRILEREAQGVEVDGARVRRGVMRVQEHHRAIAELCVRLRRDAALVERHLVDEGHATVVQAPGGEKREIERPPRHTPA